MRMLNIDNPICSAYHGFKHQTQVTSVLKSAQQLDAVASAIWVGARQLPQHNLHSKLDASWCDVGRNVSADNASCVDNVLCSLAQPMQPC